MKSFPVVNSVPMVHYCMDDPLVDHDSAMFGVSSEVIAGPLCRRRDGWRRTR